MNPGCNPLNLKDKLLKGLMDHLGNLGINEARKDIGIDERPIEYRGRL